MPARNLIVKPQSMDVAQELKTCIHTSANPSRPRRISKDRRDAARVWLAIARLLPPAALIYGGRARPSSPCNLAAALSVRPHLRSVICRHTPPLTPSVVDRDTPRRTVNRRYSS